MKSLLDRFSSYLVGRGKKVSGHKILVESLFMLREKNNKSKNILNLALQKDAFKKTKDRLTGKAKSYFSITNTKKNTSFERTQLAKNFADNYLIKNNKFSLKKTVIQKNVPTFIENQHLVSKNSIFEKVLSKSICQLCVDNVKPILETRKIRKGRITYRVPKISCVRRQEGKGIALLIENALSRGKSDARRSGSFSLNNSLKQSNSSPEPSAKRLPSSFTFEKPSLKVSEKTEVLSSVKTNKNLKTKDIRTDTMHDRTEHSSIKKGSTSNQYLFSEDNYLTQKKEKFYSIKHCLSEQFLESANGKGEGVEKKKQLHQFALQNRANLHFRWW